MTDLLAGLALLAVITLFVLLLTIRLTRGLTRRETTGVGVVAALLLVCYLRFVWRTALLSRVLPFSNVVVLSNWFPVAAAFLAGITWTHGYGTSGRRRWFGAAVVGTASVSVLVPLLGSPPRCDNVWDKNGVCRQTSWYTCTAAAAAMLLRQYGIPSEESEMARLCLTRKGTTWQGLYRGLKLKTADHGLGIRVTECSWAEFEQRFAGPVILSVGLKEDEPVPEIYTRVWGWQPGMLHSVVMLRRYGPDRVLIADPATGMEVWSLAVLKQLFRGRVVELIADSPAGD